MGPDHVQMKTETDQGWYDYGKLLLFNPSPAEPKYTLPLQTV